MILYLCVLIIFSLYQEPLKLILVMNPFLRWFCHKCGRMGSMWGKLALTHAGTCGNRSHGAWSGGREVGIERTGMGRDR
jgi:hypothetical protein